MTGAEHYLEAERLLAMAAEQQCALGSGDPAAGDRREPGQLTAMAQVHATLALAAATAPRPGWAADLAAWQDVAAPQPEDREGAQG
jgi:hypothetical protein